MHNFEKDEISQYAPNYKVKEAVSGASDTDLIVVYQIDAPNVEVAFLAKFLKEGVNP